MSSWISDCQINSTIHFHMFLYLVSCFLRVTVLLLWQSQAVSKIHVPIYPYLIIEGRWNCWELVTGTATKPRLSGNMSPNIITCENGSSNFSNNLRVVTIKLFELTQFASPNVTIHFYFVPCWGPLRCWHF